MWLSVAATNNDPLVIANYFLNTVTKHKIAPKILRMDLGTENIYCQDLQEFFTKIHKSYRYGASTRNQRIEALWSRLKKVLISWWIEFFKNMERCGLYKAELETHIEVLLFVFLPIIQRELNEIMITWNQHYVRQSATAPGGKPDVLFCAPETVNFQNQGILVSEDDLAIAKDVVGFEKIPIWKNKLLHELLECYCHIHNIELPNSTDDGLDVYVKLLTYLETDRFEV